MKKLLVAGITAVALAAAGTAQAGVGLGLRGESGLARTPMAVALPPMTLGVGGDFVASDDLFVPLRAEFGVIEGLELGGHYWYLDVPGDSKAYGLNVKYVLPEYVEKLGLGVGGHFRQQEIGDSDSNGYDAYLVASYGAGFLVPSAGLMYESITSGNNESAFRVFGSLVANILPTFSLGAEIMSSSDKLEHKSFGEEFDPDPAMWFGARFVPLPGFTVQAGVLNYADFGNPDPDGMNDFVLHVGVQYEYGFRQ